MVLVCCLEFFWGFLVGVWCFGVGRFVCSFWGLVFL